MIQQTKIERRKPTPIFFPFLGVKRGKTADDKTFLVVEGYTYVNAWVGDGWNLKRSAMVAASDDYMRWGAVREMHQPSAVGTAIGRCEVTNETGDTETVDLGVTWDDKGAFLRCKVIDEDAIRKVEEGVYRGFSVSCAFKTMRGSDVETCDWIENSLVDRPADPDAVFSLFRADDVKAEYEVMRYWDAEDNWVQGPVMFSDLIPVLEKEDFYSDLSRCWYALMESCRSQMDAGNSCAETFDQFAAYVRPMLEMGTERALTGDILRAEGERIKAGAGGVSRALFATVQTDLVQRDAELAAVTRRLAEAEAARNASESELTEARAKLATIPDPAQTKPILIAPEREFMANRNAPEPDDTEDKLQEELTELERTVRDRPSEDERRAGVVRMNVIKSQLRERGSL